MKMIFLVVLAACWVPVAGQPADTASPSTEQLGLEYLTAYLGLRPDDISFRSDYTEPDSFRLQVVAELMAEPLGMVDYLTTLKSSVVKAQPEILAGLLFVDLQTEYRRDRTGAYRPSISEMQGRHNLFYTSVSLNKILSQASIYLDIIIPRSTESMLANLDSAEIAFLTNEFKELLVTREEEEFLSVEQLDSLENLEEEYTERFTSFGHRVNTDPVVSAGIECLRQLLLDIQALQSELASGDSNTEQLLANTGYLPDNVDLSSYLGKQPGWRVGGQGSDYYTGDYSFIFDPGGDDIYDLSYDPEHPHGVIILDLDGNDRYRANSDFALGSGCLSVGILIDFGGDDRYDARSFGLGSGFFGFGILYDAEGDDWYDGDTHVQGAGSFGLGLLIDEGGQDTYRAALYSQGFGFTEGIGVIFEANGQDCYYAGGKYKDALRYSDHFLSLSQGFGYGLRPRMSGGIGAILDMRGNDTYYADIFAQACGYWWSLGMIYDSSGNDSYHCFQYGQGAATHMALGAMVDDEGDDVYFGKGLMQGCGHDYSCGLVLDRGGDDTYTASDLSQGAGSANGAGLLIDNDGDDRYLVKNAANTHGYGNPRRDFGSIGLFIDMGGSDQYTGTGRDNFYWQTDSKWGGGMDIELKPPDSTTREDP